MDIGTLISNLPREDKIVFRRLESLEKKLIRANFAVTLKIHVSKRTCCQDSQTYDYITRQFVKMMPP